MRLEFVEPKGVKVVLDGAFLIQRGFESIHLLDQPHDLQKLVSDVIDEAGYKLSLSDGEAYNILFEFPNSFSRPFKHSEIILTIHAVNINHLIESGAIVETLNGEFDMFDSPVSFEEMVDMLKQQNSGMDTLEQTMGSYDDLNEKLSSYKRDVSGATSLVPELFSAIYEFPDFDTVVDCAKQGSFVFADLTTDLYLYDNKYFLLLGVGALSEKMARDKMAFMVEYAKQASVTETVIREYGKCLIERNAVNQVVSIF